ncbi:MAG: prepilin-type N-terminal cleavage/methylation domain-containing protein [Verrucomicrobia bacterium]|jgi:prepilin-type N-terminal cleavage/methylation domain-containing protein|nr:prepilin-type N-terminal cleavage/methylation domain-containing protein [Verrucomicrobiota bacterium]MBT7068743.1 prepilin-type N-terminal cleavage/methylation domain-containing protein [Verrucomicrobiota bacterium]MBT7698830.1 prepilin-type N-terminal cleavage/methylation domain-containing protein [Verrucomicrobiota bacterium]
MGRRGFTLLELLVVMAIMAMIMGATMAAYFSIGQGARIRGAVNTLQSNLALARQRTVLQQIPLSVVFSNNVTSGTWHYQVEEAESGARIGEVMHVPPGVDLLTEAAEDIGDGDRITFRPSGSADPEFATIKLVEAVNVDQVWTLTVYGLTGLVKVVEPEPGP